MLLAVWLADCPAAISALLTLPGLVDTFVAVIADRCVLRTDRGAARNASKSRVRKSDPPPTFSQAASVR